MNQASRISMWLHLLGPALFFTTAQALLSYGFQLWDRAQYADILIPFLLLPPVLYYFFRLNGHDRPHRSRKLSYRDAALWGTITAVLAVLDLALFPAAPRPIIGPYIIPTAICAPISEELIYRGLVFSRAKRSLGPSRAALAASLLFGVAHSSLTACLAAFFLSLVLCWMNDHFQSLSAPILTHAVLNLTALLF